jgi:spore coat polysaccharide biosynthesis protein SpsF
LEIIHDMAISAIIQSRMASSRLPGKIMKEILGKPLLVYMIERVQMARSVDRVIIATTTNPEDDVVGRLAEKLGVTLYRGSEHNVLGRFYDAAKKYGCDTIMRLTGDCPLIDPELLDDLAVFYADGDYDYACNCLEPTLPDGLDAEIFSYAVLEEATTHAVRSSDLEHVTPYIRRQTGHLKIGSWKFDQDLSHLRWTVDEQEDFDFIRQIIEELYPENRLLRMRDILSFISKKPELLAINRQFKRNEGFLKSIRADGVL